MTNKKLGQNNYLRIRGAVQCEGTYNPDEVIPHFFEELTHRQHEKIEQFLTWCHKNNKKFGWGNYEEVYTEFYNATGGPTYTKEVPIEDMRPVFVEL